MQNSTTRFIFVVVINNSSLFLFFLERSGPSSQINCTLHDAYFNIERDAQWHCFVWALNRNASVFFLIHVPHQWDPHYNFGTNRKRRQQQKSVAAVAIFGRENIKRRRLRKWPGKTHQIWIVFLCRGTYKNRDSPIHTEIERLNAERNEAMDSRSFKSIHLEIQTANSLSKAPSPLSFGKPSFYSLFCNQFTYYILVSAYYLYLLWER